MKFAAMRFVGWAGEMSSWWMSGKEWKYCVWLSCARNYHHDRRWLNPSPSVISQRLNTSSASGLGLHESLWHKPHIFHWYLTLNIISSFTILTFYSSVINKWLKLPNNNWSSSIHQNGGAKQKLLIIIRSNSGWIFSSDYHYSHVQIVLIKPFKLF